MDKVLVRILTQYWNEGGKLKGGQEFQIRVSSDILMYAKDEAIEVFKKLIAEATKGYAGRHEYLDHEPVFFEPIVLQDSDFDVEFNKLYENKEE